MGPNPLPDKDVYCHRTGFAKTCFECVTQHRCQLWSQIMGVDPNTGQELNYWACADVLRNKLLIEGAKESRQTGAAVERFRNEMVKSNYTAILLHLQEKEENEKRQNRLLEGKPTKWTSNG